MRLIEALSLNNILAELKITGGNVSHQARSSIVKSKIALSKIQSEFEAHKVTTHNECDGDEKLFRELIEENLMTELEVNLSKVSEEELNLILDNCEFKTIQVESLFRNMVEN